tara:strand:+ start:361 stop:546 length:186 start_codon:yes stop_codon:yes gene_type:complete
MKITYLWSEDGREIVGRVETEQGPDGQAVETFHPMETDGETRANIERVSARMANKWRKASA